MEWFENLTSNYPLMLKLGLSILIILAIHILRLLVLKIVFKSTEDVKDRYFWRNGTKYFAVATGLIGLVFLWINEVGSVATFTGLVGAGLTITLKDPIVNMAGWVFIITRKPFKVGQRVQVGQHAGDVIDIRLFQFSINEIGNWVDADQSTGRIIHIPNGVVFTESQVNYDQGFSHIWNEIGVLVTFESNWKKAKTLLLEIVNEKEGDLTEQVRDSLRKSARKYLIFYQKLDPIVYTAIKDSGIMLSIRYLCKPQQRRGSENAIWEEILEVFAKNTDIDFAYPTQRIYYNPEEGK